MASGPVSWLALRYGEEVLLMGFGIRNALENSSERVGEEERRDQFHCINIRGMSHVSYNCGTDAHPPRPLSMKMHTGTLITISKSGYCWE